MIKNIRITEKSGELKVGSFSYTHKGKKAKCEGGSFTINPTDEECMNRLFKFKPAEGKANWVFLPTQFPARNITSFKLFRGKKPLKARKDYILDKHGAIGSKDKDMKPFKAIADFSYLPERYDSIFLNLSSGKLSLRQGTVRDTDAEEYIPATPRGSMRICNIAVSGETNLIIPTYKDADAVKQSPMKSLEKKLKKGNTIKLLGYGDSVTAFQMLPVGYVPNGQKRDRYKRYFFRYPIDTLETIDKVDFNDGIGPIHCKSGWNWALAEQLEKKHKVSVDYYNAGVGGSDSANGALPERLAKALKVEADLVVVSFGLNELGSKHTEENMLSIIKTFQDAGSEVIVMGAPKINGTRSKRDHTAWEKTNDTLANVAKKTKCTFVDTRKVNLGLKPSHQASANLYNHPGIHELKVYCETLASIF